MSMTGFNGCNANTELKEAICGLDAGLKVCGLRNFDLEVDESRAGLNISHEYMLKRSIVVKGQ